jgi:hypothetical protein
MWKGPFSRFLVDCAIKLICLVVFYKTVVGTIEGVKAASKIKTDLRKPITELACHPRHPVLVFPVFALTAPLT